MFRNPRRVFFLLILLAVLVLYIDSPYSPYTTKLGLDVSGGTHLVMQADMSGIDTASRKDALSSASEVIERRINFFGVSESVVQTSIAGESYRIIVELPGVTDVARAEGIIGQTAKLEFREFTDMAEATKAATPAELLAATKPVGVTGADLKRAQVIFSQQTGEPQVGFTLTSDGGRKFEEVTTRLVGKPLAIFLDDMLLSAPIVNGVIKDQGEITGKFTQQEAKTLALQLNAGALPVPVAVAERRVIGPTLGASSINLSIRAGAVGLAAVALYMVVQYGLLGAIALLALALYALLSFAIIRVLSITLTLPGVAGAILAVGMAVDSNILIFERYKEERRSGTPPEIAMELAFGKAWDSIRDANLTTILTALILFNPGNWQVFPSSGLVRGFAATLLIGVVTSLFTGIVVTRNFVRVLFKERKK